VRLGGFGSRFMLIVGADPARGPLFLCMNAGQMVLPCDGQQGPPVNVQYWKIKKKPGGFQINAEGTNLCLQHASDEGDLRGWACNNSPEQRFDFFDLGEDEVYKSVFGGSLGGSSGIGGPGNLKGMFGSAYRFLRAKASGLGGQMGFGGGFGGLGKWGNGMHSRTNPRRRPKMPFEKGKKEKGYRNLGFGGRGMSNRSGRFGGFGGRGGWGLGSKRSSMAGSAENLEVGDSEGDSSQGEPHHPGQDSMKYRKRRDKKNEMSEGHTDEGGYREPEDDGRSWKMPSLGGRYRRTLANKKWLRKRDLVRDQTALFDSFKEDYGMPWRRGRFRTLTAYAYSR